jgi:hypothetical protein
MEVAIFILSSGSFIRYLSIFFQMRKVLLSRILTFFPIR